MLNSIISKVVYEDMATYSQKCYLNSIIMNVEWNVNLT